MTTDTKAEELVDELRQAFEGQIRDSLRSLPPHMALQLADALCTVWLDTIAGLRISAKAKPKVDGEAIAEDWARGLSAVEIRHKHGCSRATAYNYHPNGQPKHRRKRGEKKVQQNP